jgi:hypothetical protein
VSELVQGVLAVGNDPFDTVQVELALIEQLSAAIDWEELPGLVGVIFAFDDVCNSFEHSYSIA